MTGPRQPTPTYLPVRPGDNRHRLRPEDAPPCDPELARRAYQHRVDNQLLTSSALRAHNVSVWKLTKKGGAVEYLVKQNTTIGELAKKVPLKGDRPTQVGFHSEMLVAQEIYRRPDIFNFETTVSQIFTERFPCSECQALLSQYPQFRGAPFYYYLSYTDKAWQKERAGGDWGLYLLNQYGAGPG